MMDLAEIFTEMNYFEESNQILFTIIQKEENVSPDCYFGLGCNFLGLQEYDKAEECFRKYLDLDEQGIYTEEAQELLDILQNQDYYFDEWVDFSPKQEKLLKIASKGKELLDQGEYKKAIKQLQRVVNQDPSLIFARNNLALAYFCDGRLDDAIRITEEILRDFPENIHANCNQAIFLYEKGEKQECQKYLDTILSFRTEDPEDIHKIAVTLCELKEHEKANCQLRKLLQYKPYDTKVLHYTAVSYFNLHQFKKAIQYWSKIDKIAPQNSISSFYKKYAHGFLTGNQPFRELPYHFQVPYDEVIRRVRKINDLLKLSKKDLKMKWESGESLQTLFDWGLDLNDTAIKRTILNIVAVFQDEKAEEFLRKYVLRKNEPEALKKEALALLKQMGAKEPYMAYVGNGIVEVKVNIMDYSDVQIPVELLKVSDIAIAMMNGRYEEGYQEEIRETWLDFIKAGYPDRLPKVRKKEAWAAALELYYCRRKRIPVSKRELAGIYGVSYGSLEKNYTAIKNTLHEL